MPSPKKQEGKAGEEPTYVPEVEAREDLGPRGFTYSRKITLSNYDPRKKYETEDYGVTHDSFKQAREVVQLAVEERIGELRQIKEIKTQE